MERPILFSTSMVQAILEGKKTMTRRVIKAPCEVHQEGNEIYVTRPRKFSDEYCRFHPYDCPYGKPGDILWVRETWCRGKARNGDNKTIYRADIETNLQPIHDWKPSIHMPKEYARLFLNVKNAGVEKLQDITEEDAKAEGFSRGYQSTETSSPAGTAKQAFMWTWQSLYGH
jgi:hypothetical protein